MSVLSSSLSLALSLSLYELCINFTDSEVKASMRKATGRGLSSNASLDYRDNDQDAVGLPPLDEDDNNNQLKDTPLHNRHAHQAWQAQMLILVDHYLAWKHNGLQGMGTPVLKIKSTSHMSTWSRKLTKAPMWPCYVWDYLGTHLPNLTL
ncbi:hypothetical protein F5141DRAFT_1068075 [Pisolithus sp. B1]|nr:hypothetical protein F5141DRAFT_1068075 [Pisolithus sp. B1]